MAKKMVRTAMALAVMASVVALPTAAAAESVRPGQSVVSAERASTTTSTTLFQAQQQRAGADMQDANQATYAMKWVVFFIAGVPFAWAVWKIVSP